MEMADLLNSSIMPRIIERSVFMYSSELKSKNVFAVLSDDKSTYLIDVYKDSKLVQEFEYRNVSPNFSISDNGVLAVVSERKTQLFSLNGENFLSVLNTLDGDWVFTPDGQKMVSSVQPGKDGKESGLVICDPTTGAVLENNPQVTFNPYGLRFSGDGSMWVAAEPRKNQFLFGAGKELIGRFAWNKGLLGEFPAGFAIDQENKQIFVRHTFYRFNMLSRIDSSGKIASFKTDKFDFSNVIKHGNQWLFLQEHSVKLITSYSKETTAKLFTFDTVNMKPIQVWNDNDIKTRRLLGEADMLSLSDGSLMISIGMDKPVIVASDHCTYPASKDVNFIGKPGAKPGKDAKKPEKGQEKEAAASGKKEAGGYDLAAEVKKAITAKAGNLIVEKYEEEFDCELWLADPSDILKFGTYPLYRFYEHDFISLLPDPEQEFKKWPVAHYSDEGDTEVFSPSFDKWVTWLKKQAEEDADENFSSKGKASGDIDWEKADAGKAWAYWDSIRYDSDNCEKNCLETAKVIVNAEYKKDSPLWQFIKAFHDNPKTNLGLLLKNAAEASEKAGELRTAICCYYNYFLDLDFDREWEEETFEAMVRCAKAAGSKSFCGYLDWVRKRRNGQQPG